MKLENFLTANQATLIKSIMGTDFETMSHGVETASSQEEVREILECYAHEYGLRTVFFEDEKYWKAGKEES